MENKSLEQIEKQVKTLMSLGYTKEELIKLVTVAPTLFRYDPEHIKTVLDSLGNLSKESIIDIMNKTTLIAEQENSTIEDDPHNKRR